MIDSIFIAADRLISDIAEKEIGLLFAFVKRRKNDTVFAGRGRIAVSELAEYYMLAVRRWVFRKRKHRKVKLSTFVYKSLNWAVSRICKTIKEPVITNFPAWKTMVYFHGDEGKWTDSSLLVSHDLDSFFDFEQFKDVVWDCISRDRDNQIAVMKASGLTLRQIGLEVGISGERVSQLWRRAANNLRSDLYEYENLAYCSPICRDAILR